MRLCLALCLVMFGFLFAAMATRGVFEGQREAGKVRRPVPSLGAEK